MAPNPYEQFKITPAPTPSPPDNPYAQYGTVRAGAYQPPKERSTFNMLDNYARQFASGASFSTADEISAALNAVADSATGDSTLGGDPATARPSWSKAYAANLKDERGRDRRFEAEYPITSVIAQGSGALAALPAFIPKALWHAGRTMLGTMARGALGGAALGGASGFGQGEGDFESRAKSAGYGATFGAGAGAILPPLISGVATGAKALGGRWAAENVGAPTLDKLADIAGYFAPKTRPGNLGAAAPDGGQGINIASAMDDLSTGLRSRATAMRDITEREGMDRVAQSIMRRNVPTQQIGRELLDMGPDATLANAGGRSAQNLLRTAYMMPGAQTQMIGDALEAQAAGAARRVRAPFEGETPPPTMYDARRYLEGAPEGSPFGTTPARGQGYISQVGRENYPPAWEAGKAWTGGMGPMTPDIQRLLKNDAVREAFDQVTADAAKYGREVDPLQLAHLVKQQLNKNVEAAFGTGRAINKDFVRGLADDWEKALWDANPKLRDADVAYAQANVLPERLKQGYDWMRTGAGAEQRNVSAAALDDQFPLMPPNDQTVFRVGSTNAVRDITDKGTNASRALARNIADSTGIQEKVGTIYGPDQGQSIMRMAGTERGFGETKNRVMANSQTAAVLADMAEQGGIPQALTKGTGTLTTRAWDAATDWARKQAGGNEAVRDAYSRILLETNQSANLKNLELLEALIQKRLEGSIAQTGAAGATGAAAPDFVGGRGYAAGGQVDDEGVTLRSGLGFLRNPFQEQFAARQPAQPDPVRLAMGALRQTQPTDQAGLAALLARIRSLPEREGVQAPDIQPGAATATSGVPSPSGGVFDVPDAYKDAVAQAAARYGVPANMLAATFWNESRWNPGAVNPGDQRGSINPDTGKPYDSVGIGQWGEQWAKARGLDPRDPMASIDQTGRVMGEYVQRYGNPLLARLAYGWGPGNVDAWISDGANPDKLPDGAKVWLPRTAFGIADDKAAREAFPQLVAHLKPTRRMADGGRVKPSPRERFWSPEHEGAFSAFMAFDPADP